MNGYWFAVRPDGARFVFDSEIGAAAYKAIYPECTIGPVVTLDTTDAKGAK